MKSGAYKSTFQKLSDLKEKIGQEIGLSPWHSITQEDINTFARVTDDNQWIHTDPEKSRQLSPYGTTVAHGFFVLSLASKFVYECFEIEEIKMVINYGLDRVRFPNATKVGADIRGRLSLVAFEEKTFGAWLKFKITFEIKNEEKPACVAEFIGLCYS